MDLNAIDMFVKVVEAGTFVGAAKTSGIPKSTIARRIDELESSLGVRLLQRSTRRSELTEAGRAFYERCRRILADIEEAKATVTERQREPRGTLRLTTSVLMAEAFLSEWCVEYLKKYPDVELEVFLSTRRMDLIADGFDIAVRAGPLEPSSHIVRKLARAPRYICASPSYLEQHPAPESPEALGDHECIMFRSDRTPAPWRLENAAGDRVSIDVNGRLAVNSLPSAMKACRAGLGIARLPALLCCTAIESGELVHLLPEWSTTQDWIHALYPSRQHLSATVRTFLDFIVDKLKDPPWD